MSLLLNDSFTSWNFGTSFTNAPLGTQLADNWYSGGGGVDVESSFDTDLLFQTGFAINASIYQDITVPSGTTQAKFVYAVFNNSGTANPTYKFRLSDGVTTTETAPLERTFTAGELSTGTVVLDVPSTDTTLRFSIVKLSTGVQHTLKFHQIVATAVIQVEKSDIITLADSIFLKLNHYLRLSLADAMVADDSLPTPLQSGKGLTETIQLQDWLRRRLRHQHGQGRWRN